MGKFSRLGNDLYNGKKSVDFALARYGIGRHRRGLRPRSLGQGPQSAASSSPAVRSTS